MENLKFWIRIVDSIIRKVITEAEPEIVDIINKYLGFGQYEILDKVFQQIPILDWIWYDLYLAYTSSNTSIPFETIELRLQKYVRNRLIEVLENRILLYLFGLIDKKNNIREAI